MFASLIFFLLLPGLKIQKAGCEISFATHILNRTGFGLLVVKFSSAEVLKIRFSIKC
jgi:hypothetical protein